MGEEFEKLMKKFENVNKDGEIVEDEDEWEEFFKQEEYVKIPKDRIAVLIGKKGQTKKEIEKRTKTKITIDSETGEVWITSTKETEDPLAVWKARDIVLAIGRGFSPERAFRLLNEGESSR